MKKRFRLKNGRFCRFCDFIEDTTEGLSNIRFELFYRKSPKNAHTYLDIDKKRSEKMLELFNMFKCLELKPMKIYEDNRCAITIFSDGTYTLTETHKNNFQDAISDILEKNKRIASIWVSTSF